MDVKEKTLYILITIIIFVLGCYAGYSIGKTASFVPSSKTADWQKKFVDELRKNGIIPSMPDEINSVQGIVKQINNNLIVVQTKLIPEDPLREFIPETIKVKITPETKIVKIVEKEPEVFQKEQEEFDKIVATHGDNPPADLLPPEPFKEVKVNFSVLKEGDQIIIFSNKNIKGLSEIEAAKIQIEPIY